MSGNSAPADITLEARLAGELTVNHVAARLGVKQGAVYYWLRAGDLPLPQESHRRGLHPLLH